MAGSLYEQVKAEREAQAEIDRAAAEQQAIVDAAHEEAEQSPRLSQQEREYYRAIARAATTAELPEGVPEEVRLATIPFRSTPAKAKAALEELQQDARGHIRADRKDREQEKRDMKRRIAQEKAEQEAEEQRQRDAEAARLKEEADARQAKIDAEADRVRKESRAAVTEEQKQQLVSEQVEKDLATKHAHLSEQAKGIMRHGLTERYSKEADAHLDEMAEQAAQRRIKHIEANGGADAIDDIRAKEEIAAQAARDEKETRLAAEAEAETARIAKEADDAKREAFLDRLHGRTTREAFREAKDKQDAERNPRQPETPYLSASERERLTAIANANDTSELPDDLSAEERRSLNNLAVGQRMAALSFDTMRTRAQERLNQEAEARAALVDRVRDEGLDGFTDEEIANLPTEAMNEMNDRDRRAYFDRMHQIRGAEHQATGRGERNPIGVQSFAGEASELGSDLAYQQSLFPGQAPAPAPRAPELTPASPEDDQDALFDRIYNIQDFAEWQKAVAELPEDQRDAFMQYGAERQARERAAAPAPAPVDPGDAVRVWPNPDDGRGVAPPAPVLPPRRLRRPLGGGDPYADLPARARSGVDSADPSDIAPVNPNPIDNTPRTPGQVVADWWQGRPRKSFLPQTRPSILRGGGRLIRRGFNGLVRTLNVSPDMTEEERAEADARVRAMDERDEEEVRRAPAPRPEARPRVARARRPGDRSALDDLR
jgi:hypothetical protein